LRYRYCFPVGHNLFFFARESVKLRGGFWQKCQISGKFRENKYLHILDKNDPVFSPFALLNASFV